MNISANMNKVKYTKDEEPSVTDNSSNEVIKAPGYFKLFKCVNTFLNHLYATYKCPYMKNTKGNYWSEMYDTITNYNDRNHTPLSKAKIREAVNQVILEEKVESNNVLVDTFSPQ